MEIWVCVKWVPDTAENEIEIKSDGTDIERDDLVYSVNEWDNYAVEEAIQIRDKVGGSVTVVTGGDEEAELEKPRQVGTSGQTVNPKVYLALGISGSFQHLCGLKGSPFIVAVNKNPKAPIFQVADVGIVEDILELMPELSE
jgi:electron transfer flavoprotein alpha subunit